MASATLRLSAVTFLNMSYLGDGDNGNALQGHLHPCSNHQSIVPAMWFRSGCYSVAARPLQRSRIQPRPEHLHVVTPEE